MNEERNNNNGNRIQNTQLAQKPKINLEDSLNLDTGSNSSIDKYEFQFMTSRNKTPRELGIVNEIEKHQFKKQDFIDVEREIDDNYLNMNHKYSSSLDILASYIKGQKIIYMEAKNHCEKQLNYLMLPSILLSAFATVLAGTGGNELVLMCVNAFIGCILAVINYLKLDASQEAHKISSRQYDKLQSGVEFTSGSILLFQNDLSKEDTAYQEKELREKLSNVEQKIGEIKETNQFLVPYSVRQNFPVMFNINIFSLIKKIEDHRKKTITSLKNVKNEISFIQFIQKRQDYDLDEDYKTKLVELFKLKKDLIDEILVLQSAYSMIDSMFLQEIKNAEILKRRCCRTCKLCCEPKIIDPEKINPFIAKLIDPFKSNEDFETVKQGCCVSLCCVTKRKNVIVNNRSDEKLWFRSDEDHCPDGKCGVSLVSKKQVIENKDAETNTEQNENTEEQSAKIEMIDKSVNTFQKEDFDDNETISDVIDEKITIEMQEVTSDVVLS